MAKNKTPGAAKTVRFTQVVERSGRPHPHTLWLAPEKDPELKRAIATHRVMMIETGPSGGKTDLGKVGFDASDAARGQILIFPKTLKSFDGARVVGIKFDLVEQPKLENARPPARKPAQRRAPERTSPASQESPPTPPVRSKPSQPPSSKAAEPEEEKIPPTDDARTSPDAALVREVRAALEELEAGKAVAAYKRLQKAVSGSMRRSG